MDSQESSGGGSATLYIIVFLLCVISAVVGYFQFTMSSQQAEAEKKMKDIQAKAEADMTAAKSEEEKREIQRKADLELEQAKMKVQTDAEKKALADREAKIKAAEAAVNKKLADAVARVKNAQNLQNQAKKVKADADKKNKDAAAAMAKAVASGKAVDKKLADEKKKLAADAKKKVDAANKAASAAKAQATAEAKKALNLKKSLDQVSGRLNEMRQFTDILARDLVAKFPYRSSQMDYPGNDVIVSNFGGKLTRDAAVAACLTNCANRKDCVGVTFSNDGQKCWGKTKHENLGRNNDRQTFSKIPIPTSTVKYTGANDWGGGNSIYLDRHNLDCGDDGLSRFKLERPSGNRIRYAYTCKEGINSAGTNKNSGSNDWGGGNTVYLDRHNVDCGTKPIAQFKLVRPAGNKIRYDYRCSNRPSTGPCRGANTGWNQESSQNIYLDRHNVQCNSDEVITQFKLNRNGQGKFRYDYKCCKMKI